MNRSLIFIGGCLLGMMLTTFQPHPAPAAGLRSLADGWLLDGADTARLLTRLNPEARPADGPETRGGTGYWAAVGQATLHGLPELPLTCLILGMAHSSRAWQLGVKWERTGRALLVEDDLELVFRIGRSPRIGLGCRWRRWSVTTYPAEIHGDPFLEAGWNGRVGWGRWKLTVVWHPLDPVPWHGWSGRRPLAQVEVIDHGLAMAVGFDLGADGTPHVGFQGLARLGGGLAAGIRADPATGSLGPVLAWLGAGLLVRTSHTVHPVLGVTHRMLLGFGNPEAAPW